MGKWNPFYMDNVYKLQDVSRKKVIAIYSSATDEDLLSQNILQQHINSSYIASCNVFTCAYRP